MLASSQTNSQLLNSNISVNFTASMQIFYKIHCRQTIKMMMDWIKFKVLSGLSRSLGSSNSLFQKKIKSWDLFRTQNIIWTFQQWDQNVGWIGARIQFSTQFQFQQRILPWNQLQLRKTNGNWKMPGFDLKYGILSMYGTEPTFYKNM